MREVEEVGALARAHRKSRGYTQEQIAGLSNVGTRFISEFELGKSTVELGKVLKVLQILGLELVILERQGWQNPSHPNNLKTWLKPALDEGD